MAKHLPIPAVVVDKHALVVALNEPYAIFLGVKAQECVGQPIQEVICASRMPVVLATGEAELSSPHQYHDSKGLVDRIPIWYDGQIIGGIGFVLFKDIREIGKLLEENNLLAGKLSSYKATMGDFLRPKYSLEDIIGKSDSIKELKNTVRKIAPLRVDILINGETGVGKELWAHAIHCEEERISNKKKPFVTVNCAAIPANLLESELFGYKEGAFTGAIRGGRLGKFQLADGGTIFLDEIGDMPFPMQAKILRVLQEREVESLGSSAPEPVNIRVVAATNRNLKRMVKEGAFRADLYYRLNVINLNIPPLREHPEDIPLLTQHILSQLYHKTGIYKHMNQEGLDLLEQFSWPGNVRQLYYIIERAVIKTDGDVISGKDLPAEIQPMDRVNHKTRLPRRLDDLLAQVEREEIMRTLEETNYNKCKAASILGISRSRLYRKLLQYGG